MTHVLSEKILAFELDRRVWISQLKDFTLTFAVDSLITPFKHMGFARQLAAIMFTDIQGYTRLMQISEEKAIGYRNRHRQVFEQITEKYHGRIINYYGDGTLSIFRSAVDAVRCGYALQSEFLQKPSIPVRIGIHMGDIVLTDDDIIGDSVNVASRIESLGVAGSVLVSEKVVAEINNQDDLPVTSLGSFHFKNDSQPRTVYAVALPGLTIPQKQELKGKLAEKKSGHKFSRKEVISFSILLLVLFFIGQWLSSRNHSIGIDHLAVLPFSNLMNDAKQDYLVDGIHQALISKLQLAGVKVKPWTSMMSYRDVQKSVREISNELQVNGLLEGSVIRSGDKVEIEIRLISGEDEEYLWGQAFNGDLSDIMFLYNDITKAIASEIKLALTPTVQAGMQATQKVNSDAYDLYLQGKAKLNLGTHEDVQRAIGLFNDAIAIDAKLGPAYTGLVEAYLLQGFGIVSSQEAFANFRIYAQKAIELDASMAHDHHQLAMVKLFSNWDWEGAKEELLHAIEEDPEWSTYDSYSQLMWAMGRMEESVWAARKAVSLDSTAHFAHCDLSWAYFYADELDEAEIQLERTKKLFGSDCPYHSALEVKIDVREAEASGRDLTNIIEEIHDRSLETKIWFNTYLGWIYGKAGQTEQALQVIQKMTADPANGYVDPMRLVPIYIALEDYDTAFKLLDEAYGHRSFLLLFTIKSDPWFDPIRDDPRYDQLLIKMGLKEF